MWHRLPKYFQLTVDCCLKFRNTPSSVESTNDSNRTQVPKRKIQTFCILKISRCSCDSEFFQSKWQRVFPVQVRNYRFESLLCTQLQFSSQKIQDAIAELSSRDLKHTKSQRNIYNQHWKLPQILSRLAVYAWIGTCWSYITATAGAITLIFLLTLRFLAWCLL